jgi:peptidoglycan/LPS O-acetylase OafA/YrhL
MKFIKQIDGLRFVAIFMVLIAHWLESSIQNPWLRNINYGTGVTLFFVISGFLITKILIDFKQKNRLEGRGNWYSIKSFYMRRTLRIFPIYYITIFFLLIIGFENTREFLPWLLSYTLNIKFALTNEFAGSFTHFWSLAVEEQFYILWAFLIVFIPNKYLKGLIIGSIIISIVLRIYLTYFTGYWAAANGMMITNMYSLGLGALIAYDKSFGNYFSRHIKEFKNALVYLVLIYIVVYVYPREYQPFEGFKYTSDIYLSFVYFVVVVIASNGAFNCSTKRFLENPVVLYLGKISYGLYVFHLFMGPLYFNFLQQYIPLPLNTDLEFFVLFFVLNLAMASLSWFLIEKPFVGLKKYFRY